MLDYTIDSGAIVQGSVWPATGSITVTLTKSVAWADAVTGYTWNLRVSPNRSGGAPEMTIAVTPTPTLDATKKILTLVFAASGTLTSALTVGNCFVDVTSTAAGLTTYYPTAAGRVVVRSGAGEAE